MYKYTGGGQNAYYPGVPARDLTDEEYAALPENVKDAGLYEQAPDAIAAPAAKGEYAAAPAQPKEVKS